MFSFSNIQKYHSDLKADKISCVDAVEFYFESINANDKLNAFVNLFYDEALYKAKQLDENRKNNQPLKKLHGVVIAIKDVICYKNHLVTAASNMLSGYISTYDASVVKFLLEEDAIIIGTCNCDEFAMGSSNENSVYGPTLNAKDQSKVSGGSSGGSAVAIQAKLCMISLGSDTGGSVRQPADFCGVIGLKPSYGTISRYGLIAYASSFDQIGIFGHTIQDVALVLEVISKKDDFDSTICSKEQLADISNRLVSSVKFRVGFFKQFIEHPSLDKEIASQIKNKLHQLKEMGHEIIELEFKYLDFLVPTYYILTAAEASSNLSRYDGIRFGHNANETTKNLDEFYKLNRTSGFGKEVKRRIMLGNFVLSSGYFDAYYSKAQKVRQLLIDETNNIFNQCDIILSPTSPTTAFSIGEKFKDPLSMYLADIFTVFANLTGTPAIAIPQFEHSNGLPFGVQLITKRNDELTLLQFSNILMQKN